MTTINPIDDRREGNSRGRGNDASAGAADPALTEARRTLRDLLGSWEYAFAMGARCYGGADHPAHRATRDAARLLREQIRELKDQQAQPLDNYGAEG